MRTAQDKELKEVTLELRKLNKIAHDQFTDRSQAADYQTDFYGEVKPFADNMQHYLDIWRPLADQWVSVRKPKYVFPIQIKDTYDNLAIVCVTAFQKDTRRRRFLETIKSIDYVLENILIQCEKDNK
ncbi:YppE family protein [Sporolactobacillus kofuensis]|uniref:YppE family protein n=1 Tax=Sporolactobacillus kofuensis TaxID=269672 RepID=A0ABW1WGW8_9BACL|nr:YppE family protein [Sporolactobacillus kofuensis]